MKTFNVCYKLKNTTTDELFFTKVQADNHWAAIEQVNNMNSDYMAMAIVSSKFISLFNRYTKCYNKLKSKGNLHVFRDIDNYLQEWSFHTPYIDMLGSAIVCDSLTPTGIYIAEDAASADLYELSDYSLLILVEWLEDVVKFIKSEKF